MAQGDGWTEADQRTDGVNVDITIRPAVGVTIKVVDYYLRADTSTNSAGDEAFLYDRVWSPQSFRASSNVIEANNNNTVRRTRDVATHKDVHIIHNDRGFEVRYEHGSGDTDRREFILEGIILKE